VWIFCGSWLLLNSFEFGLFSSEVVVVFGGGGHEGEGCSSFTKRGEQMHWEVRCDLDVVLGIPLHRRE
jgi:hypothetical protein